MQGILFIEELYKAIEAGLKIKTRRIIKHEICDDLKNYSYGTSVFTPENRISLRGRSEEHGLVEYFLKPKYRLGETLFVKEPYQLEHIYPCAFPDSENFKLLRPVYAFDKQPHVRKILHWKNKLFMPAKYARLFIQITNIKIERLQDITDEDAEKEGIKMHFHNDEKHFFVYPPRNKKGGLYVGDLCRVDGTYISKSSAFLNERPAYNSFKSLWQSINGPDSWDKNPWVFVYEFKKVESYHGNNHFNRSGSTCSPMGMDRL